MCFVNSVFFCRGNDIIVDKRRYSKIYCLEGYESVRGFEDYFSLDDLLGRFIVYVIYSYNLLR